MSRKALQIPHGNQKSADVSAFQYALLLLWGIFLSLPACHIEGPAIASNALDTCFLPVSQPYILLLPLQGYVLFCHHWLVLSSLFYTSHGYFEISTSKIILVLVVEVDDGREWADVYVGMLLGLLPGLPPLPYLSLLSFFCKRLSLVTELGLNSAYSNSKHYLNYC